MAYPLVQRRLLPEGGPFAPTATVTTVIGRVGTEPSGERVIGASCRVIQAGNGTGTVSLGKGGTVTAFMTTANVGAGVAGVKKTAAGADLAGNGSEYATATTVVADYIVGTNTVHPIVRFCLLVVAGDTWDDMLGV